MSRFILFKEKNLKLLLKCEKLHFFKNILLFHFAKKKKTVMEMQFASPLPAPPPLFAHSCNQDHLLHLCCPPVPHCSPSALQPSWNQSQPACPRSNVKDYPTTEGFSIDSPLSCCLHQRPEGFTEVPYFLWLHHIKQTFFFTVTTLF